MAQILHDFTVATSNDEHGWNDAEEKAFWYWFIMSDNNCWILMGGYLEKRACTLLKAYFRERPFVLWQKKHVLALH